MAKRRTKDRQRAVELRLKGWSYSQIRDEIGVGKGTLSSWLDQYPLSRIRLRELRDKNPIRIEKFRQTMRRKREEKEFRQYEKVRGKIRSLDKREVFLAGFFLYWGEGSKTSRGVVMISNTDPAVLRFSVRWFTQLGVSQKHMHVLLHLYQDMDKKTEIAFWSRELRLPVRLFHTPYIKNSKLVDVTYKNGYGHGTCHIKVYNQELYDYIMMGLRYIKEKYAKI